MQEVKFKDELKLLHDQSDLIRLGHKLRVNQVRDMILQYCSYKLSLELKKTEFLTIIMLNQVYKSDAREKASVQVLKSYERE